MKKVVIILGAGAAVPWGASLTWSITEKLLRAKNFKTKSGKNLGQFIYECLMKYYGNREDGINFETIIHALESIQDYYMNKTALGAGPNFIGSFPNWFEINGLVNEMLNYRFEEGGYVDNKGTVINLTTNDRQGAVPKERAETVYIGSVIKQYLHIIRSEIASYDNDCCEEKFKSLNTQLKSFLLFLVERGYQPRIYTTNYDRLFPKIFSSEKKFAFFDGFDKEIREGHYAANIPRIVNDEDCLNYYNLHGSIYWDHQFCMPEMEDQFICSPDQFHTFHLNNTAEYTNPGSNTLVYNVVTGYNKLQRISIEPLNAFYSIFFKDCINASLFVTIGYSFSGFHINRPIRKSIWANDTKLLHITWGKDYKSQREFGYITSEILRSKNEFGKDDFVNDKWIWSKSRKQMIFRQGFEDFIANAEWKNIENIG